MSISAIIKYLTEHLDETDITLHEGASDALINQLEQSHNITLPDDIKQFYQFSNGFESDEDIFNIIPIEEIIDSKTADRWSNLYIAEYMVYCDMWELEIDQDNPNKYIIFYTDQNSEKIILTNSFSEFIQRFLTGGVFEPGGLYFWNDEIKR